MTMNQNKCQRNTDHYRGPTVLPLQKQDSELTPRTFHLFFSFSEQGGFAIEKIVFEKDTVVVSGPFNAERLCYELSGQGWLQDRSLRTSRSSRRLSLSPSPPSPKRSPSPSPSPSTYQCRTAIRTRCRTAAEAYHVSPVSLLRLAGTVSAAVHASELAVSPAEDAPLRGDRTGLRRLRHPEDPFFGSPQGCGVPSSESRRRRRWRG
uniref:Uncharacterized protein n=1 Tax=Leersia perrieri TaxID=77586 RepID=A0A0D9W4G3_9ORYZ